MMKATAETVDPLRRSAGGCLCCHSVNLYREATLISPFLARRAMEQPPQPTSIVFCRNCGLRFFERGLSTREAARYYRDYRSEDYRAARHRDEPFYTRRAHRRIAVWLGSAGRRRALAAALAAGGAPICFESVLDFGGGNGALISEISCARRAVFDLTDAPPLPGIQRVDASNLADQGWNLVICAQTLEHASDPAALAATLTDLMGAGSWLYLEVPDEIWTNRNRSWPGHLRDRWLHWLVRRHLPLVIADTVSTTSRILLGALPPFGFVPMREHLQYFTEAALVALVHHSGLQLVWSGRNGEGQICAVARKAAA